MTAVQQAESGQTKSKKRGRARKQPEQPAEIKYDAAAIAKGKKLAATLKSGDAAEMKLGELADRLQPKYRDETLARFAEDIGLEADRLNRCRSVYRAYKDKDIKGPAPKFGVLQALQGHPKSDEIIKNDPNLTREKARTLMQDYRLGQGKDEDWRVNETRRWCAEVTEFARRGIKYGHPAQAHLDSAVLQQAVDDGEQMLATWRACAKALNTAADEVERALTPPPALPKPMFDDAPAAPGDATSGGATPDQETPDEGKPPDDATSDQETPDEAA
jgi:hypothetical protein